MATKRGQIVDTSFSGGRTVAEMWAHLFALNEALFRKGEKVMDDDDIVAAMLLAFPDRAQSQVLKEVNRVRGRYNRGGLTGQDAAPPAWLRSYRYKNLAGRAMRVSPHGRPLPDEKQVPEKET